MDAEQYRIKALHARIRELERWQEQAREDIARMERCIVALAEAAIHAPRRDAGTWRGGGHARPYLRSLTIVEDAPVWSDYSGLRSR